MITEVIFYRVNCDGCNAPLLTYREDDVYRTKSDLQEEMLRSGWRTTEENGKTLIFCPSCRFNRITDPEILKMKAELERKTAEKFEGKDPILQRVQEHFNREYLIARDELRSVQIEKEKFQDLVNKIVKNRNSK